MKSLRIVERVASGITLLFVCTCFFSCPALAQNECVGDCDDDGNCAVNELVLGVNVGLGIASVAECPAFDPNGDQEISISELLAGVSNGLLGCSPLTLTVTKTEDTADGVCDEDCSLREAIIAANASPKAVETTFSPDVFLHGFPATFTLTLEGAAEDAAATGDLDITGDFALAGFFAGAVVIDGNVTDRVLHVHAGANVSISGVTIRNGAADDGGGIFNAGTLRLENSTVSANSATPDECCGTWGGGISNKGTLTLTDSTVSDNAVVGFGGGLSNLGTLTLVNSAVSDNSAIWPGYRPRGGGIFNRSGRLLLTGSTVSGNSADEGGGIYDDGGTVVLTKSTLSGNSANDDGGGIYEASGAVMLRDSTISGNSARVNGGAAYASMGTLMLANSTLSGNSADFGGGIVNLVGNLSLTNSTVSGNSGRIGGGIFSNPEGLSLRHSTLSENTADEGAGLFIFSFASLPPPALRVGAVQQGMANTLIAGNSNGNCAGDGLGFLASGGHNLDDDGTCGLNTEGDLSKVDAHLTPLGDFGGPTETHALCAGEGVPDASCVAVSPAIDAADDETSPETDQRGNSRPQPFDGTCDIGAYEANFPLFVTKTDDTSDGACDADCSLREAIISANALAGADTVNVPAGMYVLTLAGTDEESGAGDLDVTGELNLIGAGAETTIIDGNQTDRVFQIDHVSASISGVTIQNGTAGRGAGILNHGTLILTDSTVSNNSADDLLGGGGIFNDGELRVMNSILRDNAAPWNGGFGGGISNMGTAELANTTVSANSAAIGGGILNVALLGPGRVTLRNTTLSQNSAVVGGGIVNAGDVTLTNCTLTDNSAEIRGGGIENERTVTVTNTTLSGNSAASGGGIHNRFREVRLMNSIVANSPSGNDCAGNESITSDGHNLDDDGSCDLTGPGDISNVDAHLAPLGDYGGPTDTHALCTGAGMPDASCMAASPALDAGDNAACPDTDQRGVMRPQGDTCDIGAYEAE